MDGNNHLFKTIKLESKGNVALLTFNRPDCLNAINVPMIHELATAIKLLEDDTLIRVIILSGEGRAFCAGGDLTSLANYDMVYLIEKLLKPVLNAISNSSKPWISAIDGAAAGIGSSFAMACDYTLMTKNAYIYQAFSAIGLVPDGGATWYLTQALGRKRAFEVIALGEKLTPEICLTVGLCNQVVTSASLRDTSFKIANDLVRRTQTSLEYSKKLINYATHSTLSEVISREATYQQLCYNSTEAKKLIAQFIDKNE